MKSLGRYGFNLLQAGGDWRANCRYQVKVLIAGIPIGGANVDKRTAYVEKLSAQMVEWDNQIDLLKDRAESASPESKADYTGAIAALQLKRDEAAARLQGISAASDDEWEDLKSGTDQIWGEVRIILRDAIMKIK